MATRRLKFKPKPVVGLAVRRAKDGADTSADSGNGVSDNNGEEPRGSLSSVHDVVPLSGRPSDSEIKGNSSAIEHTAVLLASEDSLCTDSVVSHDQIINKDNLVLPSLQKSQVFKQSVLLNKISGNDSMQHNTGVLCVSTNSVVSSNGAAENSEENVSDQTGFSDNDIISNPIINSNQNIISQSISRNCIPKLNFRHYSSLNTNTDSSNTTLQLNDCESVIPQTSEMIKISDCLNDNIVKINDIVDVSIDKERVVNDDCTASSSDSVVENNLTTPSNNKMVENRDNSALKLSSCSDSKFKALSRFTRPRCKPVVASNIARRKTEEINRISAICSDNSNNNNNNNNNGDQEIKNKSQTFLAKSDWILSIDKDREMCVVQSDSVTESAELQIEQNACGQSEENMRLTNISESIQNQKKTDHLLNTEIISNDETPEKSQGAEFDNSNTDKIKENQITCEEPLTFTDASVPSIISTIDTTIVLDDNSLFTATTTTTGATTTTASTISTPAEFKHYKTFSKPKRHHRTHGATFSKMGQDTLDNLKKKFGRALPDKTRLLMKDLIFYNPKTNPMSKKAQQKKPASKPDNDSVVEEILEEQRVDDVEQEEQETSQQAMPVPQLKIGPDGQVILDPKSLIIETTEMQRSRQNLENSEVILETDGKYGCYSKKRNTRHDWRPEETLQFYRALHTIGTDFSLMATLFPRRTRRELKLKFKYEEKVNLNLIDKAITNPREFDFEQLENDIKKDNEERARAEAEELRLKEELKKHKELRKQQREESYRAPRRSLALKEFNAEDIGDFRGRETKRRKKKIKTTTTTIRKSRNKRKHLDESEEECDQEMIFDYSRIDKMCSTEDQQGKKVTKRKRNTAKRKLCTNRDMSRFSKNYVNNKEVNDTNGAIDNDDVDIIANILTTTRSGRKPKRSRKRIIDEALFETKNCPKREPHQNLRKTMKNGVQQSVRKRVSDNFKTNEVATLPSNTVDMRSIEIDDHNNESNVSSLSAEMDESFMTRVSGRYNSEELTASVTRLTGRLEKRMGHLNSLEKQAPVRTTSNSSSSPLPSFSTLTPGIHNSRALSESMKIIDQLTSDVETACAEMSDEQLIGIIDEESLNQIENESIPSAVDTTVAVMNANNDGFNKANSVIHVRNSSSCNANEHSITIIALELPHSNHDDDISSNNNNNTEDSSGGDGVIADNSVSLIVPHYEVITGDMLGEEVTYFSGDARTSLVISEQCGTGEGTYLILEETTAEEECSQSEDTTTEQQNNLQQQQQLENMMTEEGITHAEESECILGE